MSTPENHPPSGLTNEQLLEHWRSVALELGEQFAKQKARADAWEAVAYFRPHPREWLDDSMKPQSEQLYEDAMKRAGANTYSPKPIN